MIFNVILLRLKSFCWHSSSWRKIANCSRNNFMAISMHHLIFEGAELSGKSWLMSQIYDRLEPKYNRNKNILDGCHWFNCDVGVYGTEHGKPVIEHFCRIFAELQDKNLLV